MKSKIQNSIKFLKRFFEPALLDKITSTKILVDGFLKSIVQVIIPVIFLPKAISLVLAGNYKDAASFIVILLISYVIISVPRSVFMLPWQYGTIYLYKKNLYRKYLTNILQVDNLLFERFGTGQILSKFNSGTDALAKVSSDFLAIILPVVMVISVGFYSLYQRSHISGLVYVIISLLLYTAISINYYHQLRIRKKGMPIFFSIQSKVTKAIMSKFEILQSGMIKKEQEVIDKNFVEFWKIEKRALNVAVITHLIWYTRPAVLMALLLLQANSVINLNVETITQITILSSVFVEGLDKFFKILTGVLNDYPKILAFWEMVDEPKMVGYEEGEKFEHRGGEIELKNISFSYEK